VVLSGFYPPALVVAARVSGVYSGAVNFRSFSYRLYRKSIAENLEDLRNKVTRPPAAPRNDLLDPLLALASFPDLLARQLGRIPAEVLVLLGDSAQIAQWSIASRVAGRIVEVREWSWSQGFKAVAEFVRPGAHIVICRTPLTEADWNVIFAANREIGAAGISTLGELVAPFLRITALTDNLDYFTALDELLPIYLGQKFFGPLAELDALFPLKARSVIEFGSFEGGQSLGLCHLGAQLTCIDARADNVAKTRAALDAFGFGTVRILGDDFHNVHARRYGRFDLAFAHGVYYHSVAPFVFLENLISLAENIFVGGYCATDDLPVQPWSELEYEGRRYRVKRYVEARDFTAGINDVAYFFHKDDLRRFFSERGFGVKVISDDPQSVTAGNFTRFLARR
jgi:predicted O-methyltransferase YrrM